MNRKAAFLTLGCKVNQYETDAMEEILEKEGYEIVDFHDSADVYVINTCSVTNIADRKCRQLIRRAKTHNPDALVVAAGCYVQSGEKTLEDTGIADILLGNNRKNDIAKVIDEYFKTHKGNQEEEAARQNKETKDNLMTDIIDINHTGEYESMELHHVTEHTRAYIKIQDGCNQFCSYCIIPYTRGRIRSEKPEKVIEEILDLAQRGYKEVVLTGIHLSSYGKDLRTTSLIDLIEQIQEIDGIERIRLGSLEPRIITEDFTKRLKKCDKVCPHFHLSLQSGCDETLRRMNRHYSTRQYEDACKLLRETYEHPALTTDVIVGFVGETEEEFEKTCQYLEKINLYEMHIFKYSVRSGTAAERMEGHLPEQVKQLRSARLLGMTARHKGEYERWYLGKTEDVLIEEKTTVEGKEYIQGYTKNYAKVAIDCTDDTNNLKSGDIISVKIDNFITDDLLHGKFLIEI